MTQKNDLVGTLNKVTTLLAQQLEVDALTLQPATALVTFGVDEFDMIELTMKLEDAFGILIQDGEISSLDTIESIAQCAAMKKTAVAHVVA